MASPNASNPTKTFNFSTDPTYDQSKHYPLLTESKFRKQKRSKTQNKIAECVSEVLNVNPTNGQPVIIQTKAEKPIASIRDIFGIPKK
jgi:hypothetical protein